MLTAYTQKTTSSDGERTETFTLDNPTVAALESVMELVDEAIKDEESGEKDVLFHLKMAIQDIWSVALDRARLNSQDS